MMKKILILTLAALLVLSACGAPAESAGYRQISQEEAAKIMAEQEDIVILDVRREDEYAGGHIPGAICIPNETIGREPIEALPDLEQTILVYCRSGNRSRQAAGKLAKLGYTNVLEFGGIGSWTGPTEVPGA